MGKGFEKGFVVFKKDIKNGQQAHEKTLLTVA